MHRHLAQVDKLINRILYDWLKSLKYFQVERGLRLNDRRALSYAVTTTDILGQVARKAAEEKKVK